MPKQIGSQRVEYPVSSAAKRSFHPAKVSSNPNFVELEEELLNYWYESGVVEDYLSRNDKSSKRFSFLDGPITANNPMGVHHAWGRTYKDLWQRYYNMRGYKQRFQNGFDCQGLWVEVNVEKELGLKNKLDIEKLGIDKFVELCKERVRKYSGVQTEQSKRLGMFMDWANSYYTMSDENNYAIWGYLKKVNDAGWLYKGRDSVAWCPRCETAISKHETLAENYHDRTHKSVYVQYPIKGRSREFLLVWTTTSWTLPLNTAIAVNPLLNYAKVEQAGQVLYVAESRQAVLKPDTKVLGSLLGSELVGLEYEGPYDDLPAVKDALKGYQHRVVAAPNLVSGDEGTGLVHIAPGAGEEDFDLGKVEELPVINGVNERGCYYTGFGELSEKAAIDNPDLIIDPLAERNFAYQTENYRHRYPSCWRCGTELIWRVVEEWYIGMDEVREKIKANTKKVHWLPQFCLDRELDWLRNMGDWMISKKRYWGLALPIWECEKCGKFEVIGSRAELKKRAIKGWDKFDRHTPHRPWIDEVKLSCSACHSTTSRVKDVGDVWLDAGIVPFSTMKYFEDRDYWKSWYPADFITESFPGQFKGWFYSLLTMATIIDDSNPFKVALGYALLVDETGRPMHKSWGNSIEFNEAATKSGADTMRWLYARSNPEGNVKFGFNVLGDVRKNFFLLLWNIYKFFIDYALLDNYKPQEVKSSNVLDRWLESRWNETLKIVDDSLKKYDPMHASSALESFVQDFSTWWLRRSRDRMGPWVKDLEDKKAAYGTFYKVLVDLVKVLAPFVPFISDTIYRNLTAERSVHLAEWPEGGLIDQKLLDDMKLARQIVELAHSQRKERSIKLRQPLAALTYTSETELPKEVEDIIAAEVNVKVTHYKKDLNFKVELDFSLTDDLKAEGAARELIRQIQDERKRLGLDRQARVRVTATEFPEAWEKEIADSVLADSIEQGLFFKVEQVK
jgi:isoleucyl-tRNA synthetase